jgi:hypothetical protein
MVNRFGIIGFLSIKLLPDCGIEHLYASGLVHFLGRSMVGQKFFKYPGGM